MMLIDDVDFRQARPRLRIETIAPRELTEFAGIPIVPPLRLLPGGSVEVWWYIEAGEVSYHHAGSTLSGARVELLQLMISRGLRLIVREVCAKCGIEPAR
jgi:hypothetical protein